MILVLLTPSEHRIHVQCVALPGHYSTYVATGMLPSQSTGDQWYMVCSADSRLLILLKRVIVESMLLSIREVHYSLQQYTSDIKITDG